MSNQIIIEDKSQNLTLNIEQPITQVIEVIGKGPKGDKGDTGLQGIQGEKGDKGDKGDTGDSIFTLTGNGVYQVTSSIQISDTLTVGKGITGSLEGTSSFSISSSYASYADTSSYTTAISGTSYYIPKFLSGGTIGNSLIYDNGTNVGIGTTSPLTLLQIGTPTSGNTTNSLMYLAGYNNATSQLRYIMNHTATGNVGIGTPYSGGILFGYGSTDGTIEGEWMRITSSGNVGIGTTSPSEKLEVSGSVKATGFKTPSGTTNQALTADGGVYDLNTKANIGDIPTKTSFTHDILVANWTLVSGKYEAVISNAGILSNSFVDVIPSNDSVDIVRSAQIYPSVLISAGSVKVYSKFLPSDTISVTVNVI